MKQFIFLIACTVFFTVAKGQRTDTTAGRAPATWKKMELAPRAAFGTQKGFYLEGGAVLQRYIYDPRHGFVANAIYVCAEWMPGRGDQKTITGIKTGAEMVFNGGAGGIEFKYLTDSDESDFMITLKQGFGIGLVNLFYGYNFSTNKYPFDRLRRHQISLAINTNLMFYHSKYERK